MNNTISIGVIDESITWQTLIGGLLNKNIKFNVISLNSCYDDFLIDYQKNVIDLLIIDINFSNANGFELIKRLQKNYPSLKVIVFSNLIDLKIENILSNFGIVNYVNKNDFVGLEKLIYKLFSLADNKSIKDYLLTNEELLLIKLICEDFDKFEICEKMCISLSSYEKKRKMLSNKISVKNTTASIAIWGLKNEINRI